MPDAAEWVRMGAGEPVPFFHVFDQPTTGTELDQPDEGDVIPDVPNDPVPEPDSEGDDQ